MTQSFANNAINANWITQLIQSLQTNPELAATLQGLATQFFAGTAAQNSKAALVNQYVDAEYDDTPNLQSDGDTESSEVLTLFADAFGFCAHCVVSDASCDSCAAGVVPDGPDDRTFMALVTPVLSQLQPKTRLELARHLRRVGQDTNAAPV